MNDQIHVQLSNFLMTRVPKRCRPHQYRRKRAVDSDNDDGDDDHLKTNRREA